MAKENKNKTPEQQGDAGKDTKAPKVDSKRQNAARVAKEHGAKTLYANSKGEYFTQKTYALASENGNAKKVSTYEF
jgi:hypothetical protein